MGDGGESCGGLRVEGRGAVLVGGRSLRRSTLSLRRSRPVAVPSADDELQRLEAAWLARIDAVEAAVGEDLPATRAAWSALMALAEAPAAGPAGLQVKLRALLRVLADAAADTDGPEWRLVVSALAAADGLAAAGDAHTG